MPSPTLVMAHTGAVSSQSGPRRSTDAAQRSDVRIAPGADVAESASIGSGCSIWHLAQVREDTDLGQDCIVGRGAYIGTGVSVGANCKIQNYALIYEPARLANGVFVGPAAVFTNDQYPRAINPDGSLKQASDWEAVGVTVDTGAAIGARAVCVAPVHIGAWAMVAAGSTVVNNVPAFALVAGSPARRIGWVGHAGHRLTPLGEEMYKCAESGRTYRQIGQELTEASS